MTPITTRTLKPTDLPALAPLFRDVFNESPFNDGWTNESATERLRELTSGPHTLGAVALHEQTIIAFAVGRLERWSDGHHYELVELCTHGAFRQRGAASATLEQLQRDLRGRGALRITLRTRPDTPAAKLYVKHGFYRSRDALFSKRL